MFANGMISLAFLNKLTYKMNILLHKILMELLLFFFFYEGEMLILILTEKIKENQEQPRSLQRGK